MYAIGFLIALFGCFLMFSGIAGMTRGVGIAGLFFSGIGALVLFFGLALVEVASGENWITPVFHPLTVMYDKLGAWHFFLACTGIALAVMVIGANISRRS